MGAGSNGPAGSTPHSDAPTNIFVHENKSLPSGVRKAWTNYYELPVSYSVELHSDLLDPSNATLATRFMPAGLCRRFCVVDEAVERLYGDALRTYFASHGVSYRRVVVAGDEENKRWESVCTILDALCEFGLHRREPIFGIGGGCVLDIVGFAASCYRRGVPYVRVPTTLLAIVDASVGVKTGVDWYHPSLGGLKNRVGSFYAPCGALLDVSFVRTQSTRHIANGLCEVMKLALVRSPALFGLLESNGADFRSGSDATALQIVELSIEVMLTELGPNLWEGVLERCVDYGHTFSKIIEMNSPGLLHGEAVNIDGFLCIGLSVGRGWLSRSVALRVTRAMHALGLPLLHGACTVDALWQGIKDGIEHRHGKLRMPLVRGEIGSYDFVNDVTREELRRALVITKELAGEVGANGT